MLRMKRSCLLFLFFLLWENASGFGVWNKEYARYWQRSEEDTIQDPPSPEQQTSSVESGVQSIEDGATDAEGSRNVPTRRLIPVDMPLEPQRPTHHFPRRYQTGPFLPFQSTTRASLLPQQDSFGLKLPDYSSGFASVRPSRQRTNAPGYFPTLNGPAFQTQESSNVDPFRNLASESLPSEQGDNAFQSMWSRVLSIQSANRPTFQTQMSNLDSLINSEFNEASNLLAPSQSLGSAPVPSRQDSYGFPSRWSTSPVQGIPSAPQPMLQTQPSYYLASFHRLGSAPVQSPQDGYGIQSRWPAAEIKSIFLENRPRFQNQVSNPLAPSQSVADLSLPLQEDGYGFQSRRSGSQMQGIPPQQDGYRFQTRWPAAEIPIVPSQYDGYGAQSSWFTSRGQTRPSAVWPELNRMPPSFGLSVQDGYNVQPRWPASHEHGIPSAIQPSQYGPEFQTQSSSKSVPFSWGLSNLYTSTPQGPQSQRAPADLLMSQTQLSGVFGSSSLPTSFQSQDIPLPQFDGLNQVPAVQAQSLYTPVFPSQETTNVFTSQTQAGADPSDPVLCFKVSPADLAVALQSNKPVTQPQSLESPFKPAASTADQTQSGVLPPAVYHRRFYPLSQKATDSTDSQAQRSTTDQNPSVSLSPSQTAAERLAADLNKKIPGDSWIELTPSDLENSA